MASADKIDDLIKEIAVKHGIALGRDDPIMILQTINERLMRDSSAAQEKILSDFKEELEGIAHQWGLDAKDKAERILNAAISSSKEVISNTLQEGATSTAVLVQSEVEQVLAETRAQVAFARKLVVWNLITALIVLLTSCFSLFKAIY